MAERYPQPVSLDATVVGNVASTDAIGVLTTVLESPVVVPAVREEIERRKRPDTSISALRSMRSVRRYRFERYRPKPTTRRSAADSMPVKRNRCRECSPTAERWRRTT
jgi:hypothetical protein